MKIRNCSALLATVLLIAFVQIASAQQRATLDHADVLIRAGQLDQARVLLGRWKKENSGGKTDPNALAHSLMLSAQLELRAEAAEDSYLAVALTHPTSPYAAEAWLRLAQARVAAGDYRQALAYLQRLMSDYPRSEHRAMGAIWLARVQQATGKSSAACTTVSDAMKLSGADSVASGLLRAEQSRACDGAAPGRPSSAPNDASSSRQSAQPAPSLPSAAPVPAPFAIQVAAFREKGNAKAVARQLAQAGFDNVRVVTVPDNALVRVRVGAFDTATSAASLLPRLKAAGYIGVVVSDVAREVNVRD